MISVQFKTNDESLVIWLRMLAAEHAKGRERVGAGTGALILVKAMRERPDMVQEILRSRQKSDTDPRLSKSE